MALYTMTYVTALGNSTTAEGSSNCRSSEAGRESCGAQTEAWRLTLSHNRGSKIYYDQARRVTFIIRLSRPPTTTTSGSVVVAIQSPWRHEL